VKHLFLLLILLPLYVDAHTTMNADEAHYDGERMILKGHVHVVDTMGMIDAEEAQVTTVRHEDQWEATHVLLIGHVKMVNDEQTQFALADRVEIFPQEKVMVFEAHTGERVLFIDRVKNMQLAAHKVRAERGDKDLVQGYGDVRFVFGTEELEKLKTQFSWE